MWKWCIPNRFFPEQKTKKSFVLLHLCPVHEVWPYILNVQQVRRLRNDSLLKTLIERMMLFNKDTIFRWFPEYIFTRLAAFNTVIHLYVSRLDELRQQSLTPRTTLLTLKYGRLATSVKISFKGQSATKKVN